MTSYTVTVNGPSGSTNITNKITSATWSRSLGDAASTLDLDCLNLTANYSMQQITLSVDGQMCFSGTIKSQSDSYDQMVKKSSLKAIDDTDKLQRIIVAETFQNLSAKQMIAALQSKYAPWILLEHVDDIGSAIDLLSFNFETFASAVDKLSEITGAHWNLDADNKLHFFLDNTSIANFAFTPSRIIDGSFSLEESATELANRVWIIGAKQASNQTITQTYVGANNNQYFSLAYVPNYPSVTENGVNKTIAVEKDDSNSKDYTYNKKEKVLKRKAGNLPTGVILQITYQPTVQVIDYFEDTQSIASYGLYEKAIRDKKITDKLAARSRGRAELKRVRKISRYAKWNSRSWRVQPGQLAKIQLSAYNIDSYWRITSIDVDFSAEDIIANLSATEVEQ